MNLSSESKRMIFACLLAFILGILFSYYILSSPKQQTFHFDSKNFKENLIQIENCSISNENNLTLDKNNIEQFYEEYYKYYELNKEWFKKTFMGLKFLQNPNDAITIAEILFNQDIDLFIETGAFEGASALFFASLMYQYRYNSTDKTIRPFKIITIDVDPKGKANIDKYPLLSSFIEFIYDSSYSDKAKQLVNLTFDQLKPKNVFISLDGDHTSNAVYQELIYYSNFLINIGNYILVQDTRLSRKWHPKYCQTSSFDGPCDGPQEAVEAFIKKQDKQKFIIDLEQEYLFSIHHKGFIKRISF